MMHGQRVRITMMEAVEVDVIPHEVPFHVPDGRRTFDASVVFGSDNRRSLMLAFDGAVMDSSGGYYVGMMPVMFVDEGQRWQTLRGEEIRLEWLE